MERALIVEVKACLVTVHEGEGGFGGEIGEGIGDAIQGIRGRLGSGFIFEQAGFESSGAAQTPIRSDHLLDHAGFHAIGRLQATEVIIQDGLENLGGLIAHDNMASEQAVGGGILRRLSFALRGHGTGRVSRIGPRSKNASKRRH